MRRIVVVNMKGGVGKTTTAVHLAAGFASRGRRTLLIDTDPQGNVAHALQLPALKTIRELMLEEIQLDEVIIKNVRPNLDVIPSATSSFSLERQLAGAMQRETILSRRLAPLKDYDTIVMDTSPAMSLMTFNALLFATEAVVPVGMDLMALIGARQTLGGIADVQALWPERPLKVLAIVPTFVNFATKATRASLDTLEKDPAMAPHLYKRGIGQCLDLTYATAQKQTIWEYAPRSRAAEDFNAFLDFVDGCSLTQLAGAHAS